MEKTLAAFEKMPFFLVKALVHFLARKLGVRNSQVEVISGHTSRLKRIKVIGTGTKTKEEIWGLMTLQS